jgi:hypothetical protein
MNSWWLGAKIKKNHYGSYCVNLPFRANRTVRNIRKNLSDNIFIGVVILSLYHYSDKITTPIKNLLVAIAVILFERFLRVHYTTGCTP